MENFEINFKQIDQIKKITLEEKNFRIKNLELFNTVGFPSKKFEDWKFTDFRQIVDNNFNKLDTKKVTSDFKKTELLKNFDHNYIILVNGSLHSYNFDHEEKSKIKISSYDNNINYDQIHCSSLTTQKMRSVSSAWTMMFRHMFQQPVKIG